MDQPEIIISANENFNGFKYTFNHFFLPDLTNITLESNLSLRIEANCKPFKNENIRFIVVDIAGTEIINSDYPVQHSAVNLEINYESETHEVGRVWNGPEEMASMRNTIKTFSDSVYSLPDRFDFEKCRFGCKVNLFTRIAIIDLRYPKPEKHTGIHRLWSEYWSPT